MLSKTKKNRDVHELIMEQIKDVENCLVSFEGFMRAATTPESVPETLRNLSVGVGKAEAEADGSLRRMIDSLGGASYLPSTREDLISIGTSCDRVANKCEFVANVVVAQKFKFPAEYTDDLMEIVRITKEQFELLEKTTTPEPEPEPEPSGSSYDNASAWGVRGGQAGNEAV